MLILDGGADLGLLGTPVRLCLGRDGEGAGLVCREDGYALGTGGTLLFPDGMGAPRPGAFASMGLGVDNAR
ncbi:hypothetical protein F0U61_42580 [Archangium violaceum]|uniref:hypothetical protein n=1 Tax=Archangium violaceum TaxID=83451 RepID=UPI002B2B2344|nr:hypothetical protein F0U61_42580 [Archangium violaceum]